MPQLSEQPPRILIRYAQTVTIVLKSCQMVDTFEVLDDPLPIFDLAGIIAPNSAPESPIPVSQAAERALVEP